MGRTDFLFVMPSVLGGAARTLDLGGCLHHYDYNMSPTPVEADRRAILNDWLAVGEDMAAAIAKVQHKVESK